MASCIAKQDNDYAQVLARLRELRHPDLALRRLKELSRSRDPHIVFAVTEHIEKRLTRPDDEVDREVLAKLLPTELSGLQAQTQILLASAYRRVPSSHPLPETEHDGLPVPVRVAWLRTHLARDPMYPVGELLTAVVVGIDWETVSSPELLLDRIARCCDFQLQSEAASQIEQALLQGWLSVERAWGLLDELLESDSPEVLVKTLKLMRLPCFVLGRRGPQGLERLLNRTEEVASACLQTIAAWPARESLLEVCLGTSNHTLQLESYRLLSEHSLPEDLDELLNLALHEPTRLAAAAISLLEGLRRRGFGLRGVTLELLLKLSLECAEVEVPAMVKLLHGSWRKWRKLLQGLPCDDPSWPFQIKVLEWANNDEATDFLVELLRNGQFFGHNGLLIETLARLRCTRVEGDVLGLLAEHPTASVFALQRIGGARTREAMLGVLRTPDGSSGLARSQALDVLGAIGEPPEELYELLDIQESRLSRLSTGSDSPQLSLLEELMRVDPQKRQAAMARLGALGGERQLFNLAEFLANTDEHVRAAARSAIREIGSRLYGLGRKAPFFLFQANGRHEAGSLVLADCLLRELKRSTAVDESQRLLEQLSELSHPRLGAALEGWRGHSDPLIRKWVLICYGNTDSPGDAEWLLSKLRSKDDTDVRWALVALGKMEAYWWAREIAACLDHSNMNIKKTAAKTLQAAGSLEAAPRLLHWLSHHDNPGFREDIRAALEAILGTAYLSVVVNLAESQSESRCRSLLTRAMDHKLSGRAAAHLFRLERPLADLLWELLEEAEISLRDHDLAHLDRVLGDWNVPRPAMSQLVTTAPTAKALMPWLDGRDAGGGLEATLIDLLKEPLADSCRRDLHAHLPALLSLAVRSPARVQAQLCDLLSRLTPRLEPAEKVVMIPKLRCLLDSASTSFEVVLELLRECAAVPTLEEANLAWSSTRPSLRRWAFHYLSLTGALTYERLVEALQDKGSLPLRGELLNYGLSQGWAERLLQPACTSDPPFVEELRQAWEASRQGSPPTEALLACWKSGDEAEELLEWLFTCEGPEIEQIALHILEHSPAHRWCAVFFLRKRRSSGCAQRVTELLASREPAVRNAAAMVLLKWGGGSHRKAVTTAATRRQLDPCQIPLRLTSQELDEMLAAQAGEPLTEEVLYLISIARTSPRHRLQALLELRRAPQEVDLWKFRAAFSAFPTEMLLAHLRLDLETEQWGVLEFLRRCDPVPSEIVRRLGSSDVFEVRACLELLERWGRDLSGRGLEEALHKALSSELKLALPVYCQLSVWHQAGEGARLLKNLQPFLSEPDDRKFVLRVLLGSLSRFPEPERLAILLGLKGSEALEKLAELYMESPCTMQSFPDPIRHQVVEQVLEMTQSSHPELAGAALRRIITDHQEHALVALEGALEHPQSRIRAYAHRMLKRRLPKSEFLEITVALLSDPVPEFRKRAVKVLSFARYSPAIRRIVKLLRDRKRRVDRVAREGLIYYGRSALPELRGALAKARPDHRPDIREVIQEIEQRGYSSSSSEK